MLNKDKLEARINEIDAVINEQQKILNQTQANLLALTGAKNELNRLLTNLQEVKSDAEQENVAATAD